MSENVSSMLILLLGTKVPETEDESSTHETFVQKNESSWLQKFHESQKVIVIIVIKRRTVSYICECILKHLCKYQ